MTRFDARRAARREIMLHLDGRRIDNSRSRPPPRFIYISLGFKIQRELLLKETFPFMGDVRKSIIHAALASNSVDQHMAAIPATKRQARPPTRANRPLRGAERAASVKRQAGQRPPAARVQQHLQQHLQQRHAYCLKKKLLAALPAPAPLASVSFLLWRFFLPSSFLA